jgi:hypothetical protein
MSRLTAFIVVTLCSAAPLLAQQPPPPLPPAQAVTPPPAPLGAPAIRPGQTPSAPRPERQTPPPSARQAPPPPGPIDPAQLVNVRVELTIAEAEGSNAPMKKTVVLLTSGLSRGSIRSTISRADAPGSMQLNVDARPNILKDGRIGLDLTFYYTPERPPQSVESARQADLNESMSVYLTPGKPLLVSQSADPKGDRKVTVEVTATIVK